MHQHYLRMFLYLQFVLFSSLTIANTEKEHLSFIHHLYAGVMAGYGATTWDGLVPSTKNLNLAISMSTPIAVSEGGGVTGAFAGIEVLPVFAVEAGYMHYPNAKIYFDTMSLFSFDNNDLTTLNSRTESVHLLAKIMFYIPKTLLRIYSAAGVGGVHREDMLLDSWRVSPTFSVGLNYHLTDHFMAELGGYYTAGYGESELNPTVSYFPFLYSGVLKIAYFL